MGMTSLHTVDFCLEAGPARDIWGTLTLPGQPSLKPVVVMAHGFLGFKDWAFFPWLASFFAERGFPVVRFNFSGSGMGPQVDGPFGELEAFRNDSISRQVQDLHVLLDAVTKGKFGPDLPASPRVLLWGHSRGGAIAILGSVNRSEVAGVATWATISRVNRYLYEAKQAWRKEGAAPFESSRTGQTLHYDLGFLDDVERWGKEGDVPTYLHHLKVPVLLLHGSEDTSVKPDESESLAAIYRRSQLVLLAHADHKFKSVHPFTVPSEVLTQAAERTWAFFESIR